MLIPKTVAEKAVAIAAVDLAEQATRKRPPFDRVQVKGGIDEYGPLVQSWSPADRDRLIDCAVAVAKFRVGGELFRDDSAFAFFSSLDDQLRPILAGRRKPSTGEQWLARESYSIRDRQQVVREEMERFFPDFTPTKGFFGRSIPGTTVFTRPFLPNSRLFIAPSLGENRSAGQFTCHFGIEKPFYSENPGSFYFSNIVGVYYTPAELREAVQANLRLLSPLMPAFAERIEQALRSQDLRMERGPADPLASTKRLED